MSLRIIVEQVAFLAVLMGVGYIGGKVKLLSDNDNRSMTAILTNIALPALTLSAFTIAYSKETLKGIIIVFVFSLLAHLIAALLGRLAFIRYSKEKNKILRFANTFSNAAFMGLPFIHALLGDLALLYASVYIISFNIFVWTYGENLLRQTENKFEIKDFILSPPIISIIIGMIIFFINRPLPNFVYQPITMLAATTTPLAMLILGERSSRIKLKEILFDVDIYYLSVIKLLVTPLLILFLLKFIPIDPLIKNVIIVMQSLPVAILTVVLSQKHDQNIDFASKIAVATHLLSIFTIPIIAYFL